MHPDDLATLAPKAPGVEKEAQPTAPAENVPDPDAFFEIYWPYFEPPIDQAWSAGL